MSETLKTLFLVGAGNQTVLALGAFVVLMAGFALIDFAQNTLTFVGSVVLGAGFAEIGL